MSLFAAGCIGGAAVVVAVVALERLTRALRELDQLRGAHVEALDLLEDLSRRNEVTEEDP